MEYAHDNPELYKIVTIQNIDDEDFICYYNKSRNPKAYVVKAGSTMRYPKFLAKHIVKHLVDHILTKQEKKTSNQQYRNELLEKIVIGEEKDESLQPVMTQEEISLSKVDDLNRENELDALLKNRKDESGKMPGRPKKKPSEKIPSELKNAKDPDELSNNRVNTTPPKTSEDPTRQDLMNYAKKDLGLTLDSKTKKAFDKLSVEELVKELDYPLGE